MQSLYENDKMFALQYITAKGGYIITYQRPVDERKMLTRCHEKKTTEK